MVHLIGCMVRALRPAIGGLLLWTAVAWGQRPSDADTAALIERARQKALDYSRSLPDFVCTELVRRYSSGGAGWVSTDMLTVKLRYYQQVEEHKLQLINGKPTDRKFEDLGATTSTGEFGGVLRMIFNPASEAVFDWESWKTVRKHRAGVYQYAVSAAHSPYRLTSEKRRAIVGIHGVLEIDSETGEVLQLTYIAYDIPKELALESAVTTVDYDFADVGGRNYLLPARSETEVHSLQLRTRNKMEFREYRKFSADSVIDFGLGK
jgi:hypothetical protein